MPVRTISLAVCIAALALPATAAPSFLVLHDFRGGEDGASPLPGSAAHLVASGGAFYGVANGEYAAGDWGSVFSLTPPATAGGPWKVQTIYRFNTSTKGANPASLTPDGKGGFYVVSFDGGSGTCSAYQGAPLGCGNVFHLTPPSAGQAAWSFNLIHAFTGGTGGAAPISGLTPGKDGLLFGTTEEQGDAPADCFGTGTGCGTVFALKPPALAGQPWSYHVLYIFKGGSDGGAPEDGLTAGPNGSLIGATAFGGANNAGVIYSLTPPAASGGAWTESTLYNFTAGPDGGYPQPPPIFDGAKLVGTAYTGGSAGLGVIYELTPPSSGGLPWTETVLHSFTGGADGAYPNSTVTPLPGGAYATTTSFGGSATCTIANEPPGCGTVVKIAPPSSAGGAWTETVLHGFTGGRDGALVMGGLTTTANGGLLGATQYGGNPKVCTTNALPGCGTAFEVMP